VRHEVALGTDHGSAEEALDAALAASFDASGAWREPVPEWQQPESQAERKQMMQVLEGCMACLPPQTRRVFVMRAWLGFESDEIRARLDLSADNVRTILHRARMALRECMQRRWIGDGKGAARA
jgi:RNA polymerase sigma-70 factor (ECF subfamily)